MKRLLMCAVLSAALLGRCTPVTMPKTEIQTESSDVSEEQNSGYTPLNYEYQKGMWLPYLRYGEYMQGKDAESFRRAIRKCFAEAKDNGINTVYLHIRPTGDAYYDTDLFPKGVYSDGSYDPLKIMLEEAHDMGLSAHGWINPLRLQTVEEMEKVPDSFITKQWYLSGDGRNIGEVSGRLYLRPDSPDVRELLSSEIREIINTYDIDGIHIDDYFYPSDDEAFDAEAFASSGADDLAQWRRDSVSDMVKAMYSAVKEADEKVLFGISPQGNIAADEDQQYADVKRWMREDGFCDYIIPQIYYGFLNETMPFLPVLAQWESLARNSKVKLVIGLGAYKLGKDDIWAGASAETEWRDDPEIIQKQIKAVADSSADGYALYY